MTLAWFASRPRSGTKKENINKIRLAPVISGGGPGDNFDSDGRSRATSAMINFLLDFGNEDGLSGYVGPGIGLANVKSDPSTLTPNGIVEFSDSDSGIAWQGIAGVRY